MAPMEQPHLERIQKLYQEYRELYRAETETPYKYALANRVIALAEALLSFEYSLDVDIVYGGCLRYANDYIDQQC